MPTSRRLPILHALLVALGIAGCAMSGSKPLPTPPPTVPVALHPPDAQLLMLHAHGSGAQIYTCRSSTDAATFGWSLKAPDAELTDSTGRYIGRHYGGPTWESMDGSKVIGEVVAHDDGPDPAAIAWLLLRAKSNSGAGVFAQVAFIQRLQTVGGKAPATGCDQDHAGTEARIPYTAEYLFYTPKP